MQSRVASSIKRRIQWILINLNGSSLSIVDQFYLNAASVRNEPCSPVSTAPVKSSTGGAGFDFLRLPVAYSWTHALHCQHYKEHNCKKPKSRRSAWPIETVSLRLLWPAMQLLPLARWNIQNSTYSYECPYHMHLHIVSTQYFHTVAFMQPNFLRIHSGTKSPFCLIDR